MTLKSAVIRSILQQNATFLISLLTGVVIARIIAPAEFGHYSLAMAVMFVVMALKDFGVAPFVISDPDQGDDLLRAGFGLSLTLTCLLAALLFLASWPLGAFYDSEMLGQILRIAAFGPLALALVFPGTVMLSRAMRYDALLVIGVAGALVQGAVALLLAAWGWGALALGWGYLAGALASAAITIAYCPRTLTLPPGFAGWGRIAGFSGVMSLTLLVGSTATSTPQLLIGRMVGVADAALFSRASTVVSIVLSAFFFAVTRPMLPRLAETERQAGGIAPIYLRIVACVTGLAWPAYAALCVWAAPVIVLLYGPNWAGAAAMIAPIAIGQAMTLAVAPHHDVLIVKRRQRLLLVSELMILLVTAALLAAALMAGLPASQAIWALTAGGAFFALWYFVALRRVVGFKALALAAVWGRSFVATVAVLPPLAVFRLLYDAGMLPMVPAMLASGLVAAGLWLIALRITRHELHAQLEPMLPILPAPFARQIAISKEQP